jgi:hypothetical protein
MKNQLIWGLRMFATSRLQARGCKTNTVLPTRILGLHPMEPMSLPLLMKFSFARNLRFLDHGDVSSSVLRITCLRNVVGSSCFLVRVALNGDGGHFPLVKKELDSFWTFPSKLVCR